MKKWLVDSWWAVRRLVGLAFGMSDRIEVGVVALRVEELVKYGGRVRTSTANMLYYHICKKSNCKHYRDCPNDHKMEAVCDLDALLKKGHDNYIAYCEEGKHVITKLKDTQLIRVDDRQTSRKSKEELICESLFPILESSCDAIENEVPNGLHRPTATKYPEPIGYQRKKALAILPALQRVTAERLWKRWAEKGIEPHEFVQPESRSMKSALNPFHADFINLRKGSGDQVSAPHFVEKFAEALDRFTCGWQRFSDGLTEDFGRTPGVLKVQSAVSQILPVFCSWFNALDREDELKRLALKLSEALDEFSIELGSMRERAFGTQSAYAERDKRAFSDVANDGFASANPTPQSENAQLASKEQLDSVEGSSQFKNALSASKGSGEPTQSENTKGTHRGNSKSVELSPALIDLFRRGTEMTREISRRVKNCEAAYLGKSKKPPKYLLSATFDSKSGPSLPYFAETIHVIRKEIADRRPRHGEVLDTFERESVATLELLRVFFVRLSDYLEPSRSEKLKKSLYVFRVAQGRFFKQLHEGCSLIGSVFESIVSEGVGLNTASVYLDQMADALRAREEQMGWGFRTQVAGLNAGRVSDLGTQSPSANAKLGETCAATTPPPEGEGYAATTFRPASFKAPVGQNADKAFFDCGVATKGSVVARPLETATRLGLSPSGFPTPSARRIPSENASSCVSRSDLRSNMGEANKHLKPLIEYFDELRGVCEETIAVIESKSGERPARSISEAMFRDREFLKLTKALTFILPDQSPDAFRQADVNRLLVASNGFLQTAKKIVGGFEPDKLSEEFRHFLVYLQHDEGNEPLVRRQMLDYSTATLDTLWRLLGYSIDRGEKRLHYQLPADAEGETNRARQSRDDALAEWEGHYSPDKPLRKNAVEFLIDLRDLINVAILDSPLPFQCHSAVTKSKKALYQTELGLALTMDTRIHYASDLDDDGITSTPWEVSPWVTQARAEVFAALKNTFNSRIDAMPKVSESARLWAEAKAMLEKNLSHDQPLLDNDQVTAFMELCKIAASKGFAEQELLKSNFRQKSYEGFVEYLTDATKILSEPLRFLDDDKEQFVSTLPDKLRMAFKDASRAECILLDRSIRAMEQGERRSYEFNLPGAPRLRRAIIPFTKSFFGWRNNLPEGCLDEGVREELLRYESDFIQAWIGFLDDLPNRIDDKETVNKTIAAVCEMLKIHQRRFQCGEDKIDHDEYSVDLINLREALADVVAALRKRKAASAEDAQVDEFSTCATTDELIGRIRECDAKEEAALVEKIGRLFRKNWFLVSPQDGKDGGKPNCEPYFDAIVSTLEGEIKALAEGSVRTPISCSAWQTILPELITFPYDVNDYYVVPEDDDDPTSDEFTLRDGTKVHIGCYSTPHPVSQRIDRIIELTEKYLTDALRFARQIGSKSEDKWADALWRLNSIKCARRMPESRPLLNDMAKYMIEAAARLDVDIKLLGGAKPAAADEPSPEPEAEPKPVGEFKPVKFEWRGPMVKRYEKLQKRLTPTPTERTVETDIDYVAYCAFDYYRILTEWVDYLRGETDEKPKPVVLPGIGERSVGDWLVETIKPTILNPMKDIIENLPSLNTADGKYPLKRIDEMFEALNLLAAILSHCEEELQSDEGSCMGLAAMRNYELHMLVCPDKTPFGKIVLERKLIAEAFVGFYKAFCGAAWALKDKVAKRESGKIDLSQLDKDIILQQDKDHPEYELLQIEIDTLYSLPEASPWRFLRICRIVTRALERASEEHDIDLPNYRWFVQGLSLIVRGLGHATGDDNEITSDRVNVREALQNLVTAFIRWQVMCMSYGRRNPALIDRIIGNLSLPQGSLDDEDPGAYGKFIEKTFFEERDGGLYFRPGPLASLLETCEQKLVDQRLLPEDVTTLVSLYSHFFIEENDMGWFDEDRDDFMTKAISVIYNSRHPIKGESTAAYEQLLSDRGKYLPAEIAEAVIAKMKENGFTPQSVTTEPPTAPEVKSKTFEVLKRLADVVDDACKDSKKGAFLYKRKAYVEAVNELWDNQTEPEYAVSRKEFPQISKLWRSIRLNLVAYAKCIIGHSKWLVEEINTEHSHFIIRPFKTVDERPHVLDAEIVKYLHSSLQLPEAPRLTIPKKTAKKKSTDDQIDSATLKYEHYRFVTDKDMRTIVDAKHGKPDFDIQPYLNFKESAAKAIKLMCDAAKNKVNDGWVPSAPNKFRLIFQGKKYKRFWFEQLEEGVIEGKHHWRLIPDKVFPVVWCKRHKKSIKF